MQEQQSFTRRGFVGGAVAVGFTAAAAAQDPAKAAPQTSETPAGLRSVILVRHAEKASENPQDPSLSETGKARAAALVQLLGETRITHVWTSEFKRTKETASAVAEKHQLTAVAIPGRDPGALAARLKDLAPGSISLVVGHSNTLPAVAKALGATLSGLSGGTDLRDDEYDRCAVIAYGHANEPPSLLELRYGAR